MVLKTDHLLHSALAAATTLLDISSQDPDPRVVKFAPKYKLVFSLLNEDATTGEALYEWDAQGLINRALFLSLFLQTRFTK
jgi:phosphatidylinositol glycan class S